MGSHVVSLPASARSTVVVVEPGKTLSFSMNMDHAVFTRPEASADGHKSPDLLVHFENGAALVLKNFFAPGEGGDNLPTLELADGTIITGEAFLAGINPDFDISTAAGATAAPSSGGISDFSEGAGDLLGGVDRLGSLGTEPFGRSGLSTSEVLLSSSSAAVAAPGEGAGGVPNADPSEGGDSVVISNLSNFIVAQQDAVLSRWVLDDLASDDEINYTIKDYTAGGSAAFIARGEDALNTATVANGDLTVAAAGSPATDADEARLSVVYAMEGGKASLSADNVTIAAASSGFTAGDAPTHGSSVTGIRSAGAVDSAGGDPEESGYSKGTKSDVSIVAVDAVDGAVNVGVSAGGTAGDHASSTYAGIAATEQGQVHITGTKDVTVTVDAGAAGDDLAVAGMYGIFSGYGLGQGDKTQYSEFPHTEWESNYRYKQYITELHSQYMEQKTGSVWDYQEFSANQHLQSEVNIASGGNVVVEVDLGQRGTTDGSVSGIMTHYGDVNIHAEKSVTVSVHSGAAHTGDVDGKLSALTAKGGVVAIEAKDDVVLSLDAAGNNLAVVNIIPPPAYMTVHDKQYSSLAGKNVHITGRAGYTADSAENHIEGISTVGSAGLKMVGFTVDADEAFTIDVAAQNQGGATSATGIRAAEGSVHTPSAQPGFAFGVYAEEMNIIAAVESAPGTSLAEESRATGISVEGVTLALHGYDGDPHNLLEGGYIGSSGDLVAGYMPRLNIEATGGHYATGIELVGKDGDYGLTSAAGIHAEEIAIAVQSDSSVDQSAGYGINAAANGKYVSAYLRADTVTIAVQGAGQAVGLSADGGAGGWADITLSGTQVYEKYDAWSHTLVEQSGIKVSIDCTLTGPEQLRGIAIQALNNGCVTIDGTTEGSYRGPTVTDNSSILLNGHVLAQGEESQSSQPTIALKTDAGDDRIEINGDLTANFNGRISIETRDGNDLVNINGNITASNGSEVSIDTGDGNDVLMLNGDIAASDDSWLSLNTGAGHDLLVLSAPDAETFNEWYQDWFAANGLESVNAESLIVQGVADQASIDWLLGMAETAHISVQVLEPGVELTMVNDMSRFADGFALDGSGDNDMLYVRFNSEEDSIDPLGDVLSDGSVTGLESLLLDMTTGGGGSGAVDLDVVGTLFERIRDSGENHDAKVILRADGGDGLSDALSNGGWVQGDETIVNGIACNVYIQQAGDEENMLYVQTITGF